MIYLVPRERFELPKGFIILNTLFFLKMATPAGYAPATSDRQSDILLLNYGAMLYWNRGWKSNPLTTVLQTEP